MHDDHTFFGITTLGEKGQAVIPAQARLALGVTKGEKLLVFGMGGDMLVLSRLSQLEKFASHLESKLKTLRTIVKKTK